MRFVTFEHRGQARLGLVEGENVVDLAQVAPDLPRDLHGLIAADAFEAAAKAGRAARPFDHHALKGLKFLPPIPSPGKIICLGLNYADHAAEGGHAKSEYPSFFLRATTSLAAHDEALLRPL